jgi:capsid protein
VGPFVQTCLRGAAAAVGMAYHSLANDPGSVNYSTARVALLEERDMWQAIQGWYVEHFCEPDAVDWMRGCFLDGTLPDKYWKYRNSLRFQAKTWQWVDPLKEVGADIEAMDAKLKSRTQIAAERGEDLEDVFTEIQQEQELAASMGISLQPVKPTVSGVPKDPAVAEGDPGTGAGGNGQGKMRRRWTDPQLASPAE